MAGQNINVGDVSVWNDADHLYVKYEATDGWYLIGSHVHFATSLDGIPQKNGNPIPGKFDYAMEHDPEVLEYTYEIDLNGLDPGTVYIATHADVLLLDRKDKIIQEETAWGDGVDFPGANWATYFTYETDNVPPSISITNPVNNSVTTTTTPYITIEFTDNDSGINLSSLAIQINRTDSTSLFGVTNTRATCQVTIPLPSGSYVIFVSVSDNAGNTSTAESNFTIGSSTAPIRYIFSVANNDWIFASPGDGTCTEYLSRENLGLSDPSDVVSVSRARPGDNLFFTLSGQGGILQSPCDGPNSHYFNNTQLGLDDNDQICAEHTGLDGSASFSVEGKPDIYQSSGANTNSFYMQNAQLGLADSVQVSCLHIDYDNKIYFCRSDQPGIFQSTGDGRNSQILTAADLGVSSSAIDGFAILPENIPPTISITNPSDGSTVDTMTPDISISFSDPDSGVNIASFAAEINGADSTSLFNVTSTGANYQVSTPLPMGNNVVTAGISDNVGNASSATSSFTVDVFQAVLTATPTKGGIPIEVQFSAKVVGGVSPYSYAWDINGDGVVDDNRESFSYIYQLYGTCGVTLTVKDSIGRSASDSVTISALSAPAVVASASPTNGDAPLDVQFSATVTDPDGTIDLYEWDFDGDGTYDYSDSTTASTTITYGTAGLYQATIRITDNDDLTGTDTVTIAVGATPSASTTAVPMTGPAPLEVTFTGIGSDPDGTVDLYEWDFHGDGTYDWSSTTTGNTTFTYTSSGIFNATLRVTDNDGLIGTDSVLISVSGPPIANPKAYPTSGDGPLEVTFFCDGDDLDGSLVAFAWDFDGNGTYDWSAKISKNATHTYNTAGTYNAILKVTDNEGLTGTASITITVTDPNPEGYPTATADANSTNGVAPLSVALIGKGTDPNGTIAKYEWDFEGDGIYDWDEPHRPSGPLGLLIDVGYRSTPIFVDIDGDGDLDLFVGESYGRIYYYRNDGSNTSPFWTQEGMIADSGGSTIDVGSYSSPSFVDIDNDGDYDMFVGESGGRIHFYRNDAAGWTSMGWLTDSGGNTMDVGSYSSPIFMDIDGDSDYDLFIGEYYGRIYYYHNDGDVFSAIWNLVSTRYNYTGVDYNATPSLIDIDNDGDYDLFIGERYGRTYFYRNDGDVNTPIWTSMGTLSDSGGDIIDVGNYSHPTFVDIDGDGDYDMFVGENNGRIYFYRNVGDATSPIWTLVTTNYNSIDLSYYSSPTFVDIDNDDDYDMFIGEYYGRIYFYRNDGDAISPTWTSMGTIVDVGYKSAPVFVDIDNDGDYDMFVGENYGRIYYYQNDGDIYSPSWTLVSNNYKDIHVGSYSTPALVDIDNDGDHDILVGNSYGQVYLYPTVGFVVHIYNTPGTYQATLRVTDNDGLTDTDSATINIYSSGSPSAVASASPTFGDAPLSVSFTGTGTDPDGTITLYEWDFDGDGTYDWSSTTTGNTSHTYTKVGAVNAGFRVTDNDGKTAVDSVTIKTILGISTSRTGVFNPTAGQTGSISSTLTGDAIVTIRVIDEAGNVVRTLVDNVSRAGGSYSDVWDGKDESGDLVRDGVYYFLIQYTVNGETYTYDLRETATFQQNYSGLTHTRSFSPYEDDFYEVTYYLSKPSEVSMYIWAWPYYMGPVKHVRTLLVRELRGAGYHTELWDGTDDKGALVPTDKSYAMAQVFWEISDNGIIITGDRPEITNVSADPNYFSPAYNPYGTQPTQHTIVSFKLSEATDVDCRIVNSEGVLVRTITKNNLPAGANNIIWDGKDMSGKLVKEGSYRITFTAIDGDGNRSMSRSALVVVYY